MLLLEALEQDSENAILRYNLGYCSLRGEMDEARKDPGNSEGWINWLRLLRELGKIEDARDVTLNALELRPENAHLRFDKML